MLLRQCATVWLKVDPEDHMRRVLAQGDTRPMAASAKAIQDLRLILAGRSPCYARADFTVDTSAQPLAETFEKLRERVLETVRR